MLAEEWIEFVQKDIRNMLIGTPISEVSLHLARERVQFHLNELPTPEPLGVRAFNSIQMNTVQGIDIALDHNHTTHYSPD